MSEQLTQNLDPILPPEESSASEEMNSRIEKHREFVASLSPEKKDAYDAVMKKGYELHGAAFTDMMLGTETPQHNAESTPEISETSVDHVEIPAEVVNDAEDLVEAVMSPQSEEQLTRQIVETESGLVERVDADLGEGVQMGVLSDREGVQAIDISVDEGGEQHTIAILKPESSDPQLMIDGESAKIEEMPIAQDVVEHIKDEVKKKNAEQPNSEDDESKDAERSPEQPDEELEKKRAKFALDFVKAYASNPVTREYLTRAGINLSELGKRFQSGEVTIDEGQIAQMRQLINEAHFKGSAIWDTQPGGRSALQQAAEQKRLELSNILRQF